jgi:hypothetical protein
MTRGSPLEEQTGVTLGTRILSFAQKQGARMRPAPIVAISGNRLRDPTTGGPVGDPPRYMQGITPPMK